MPRLALTATADPRTQADILVQLGIPEDRADRRRLRPANIRYRRPRTAPGPAQGVAEGPTRAGHRLRDEPRSDREDCRAARPAVAPALAYHAGLDPGSFRQRNQSAFVDSARKW